MNSRDRVFAVLQGEIPDRVPYMEMFIDPKVIDAITPGMSGDDFFDYADIDVVTCLSITENRNNVQWVDRSKRLWRDKWGALQQDTDEVLSVTQPPARIETDADLNAYVPPDPNQSQVIEHVHRLVKRFKGQRAIAVVGEAAFAPSQYLRVGLENLSYDYVDRPAFARKLAKIGTEYHVELYRKLIAEGVEIVVLGDDYASGIGPLISPDHFDAYILPGLKTVVSAIKDAGGYVIKHSDGNLWKLMDRLTSIDIDMLGPLEPAYMNLEKVRDAAGGHIGVLGNIDVDLLSRGTTQQVREATRKLMRRVSPGGRHIVSSGNSISSSVKGENLMAMIETVKEYGQYPIK